MRLVQNTGNDRVIDLLRDWLVPGSSVDVMSPVFSIFAYAEVRELLESTSWRLLLGAPEEVEASLFGGSADIAARGRLQLYFRNPRMYRKLDGFRDRALATI
jgi:hypothetical protein